MRVLHSFHGTYDNDETYELPDARETAASGPGDGIGERIALDAELHGVILRGAKNRLRGRPQGGEPQLWDFPWTEHPATCS